MKKRLLLLLMTAVCCCHHALSQEVLLPYGQLSQEAWTAKYYFAANTAEGPADGWFAPGFNDAEWADIEGPISTSSGLSYKNTAWEKLYSGYWLRRSFNVKNLDMLNAIYLLAKHDDCCEIYLNGTQIYNNRAPLSGSNYTNVLLTEVQRSLLKTGSNVMAVHVKDSLGGQAFIDFGLYAYPSPQVTNPGFENNKTGWTVTGSNISVGGQDFNRMLRSEYTYPFDAHQTIVNVPRGLYRLRVQAFQRIGSVEDAWGLYGKNTIYTRMYMNDAEKKVKDTFDEAVTPNIYRSGEFITTGEKTYVPDYATSTSIAFSNGMYENELYAYIDNDTLTIGVKCDETPIYQWTCFDNFRLDYISEKVLKLVTDTATLLTNIPVYSEYKTQAKTLLAELAAASTYKAKSAVIVKHQPSFADALNSVRNYAALKDSMAVMQQKLDAGKKVSPTTQAEAKALIAEISAAIAAGTLSNKDCMFRFTDLDRMSKRLDYNYVEVVGNAAGFLGDNVLSQVEYFTEVHSLKVTGELNDADLTTISTRMTNLHEIDLAGVKLAALPNRMFYQSKTIERVVMPQTLTSVGEYAFYECPWLNSVILSPVLETINRYAFYRCPSMAKIALPATLTTIGDYAFYDCYDLRELVLPEGLTTLGQQAFRYCLSLKKIVLPSTLKTIPSYCFGGCHLEDVQLAEGLESIESYAFHTTNSSSTLGDGIQRRFYNNTLQHITFPNSLRRIAAYAFQYNKALSNIQFNEGLYQIEDNAFYDCDALTEVTLPSTLVLANSSPFDYCDNLKKVTCLSIEPPYMTDQIPYGVSMDGRELYVPALSINAYKQTTGWDKFPVIKPIDHLPANISIVSNFRLTLPETIPADYKPNVSLIHDKMGTSYYQYGSLNVIGSGTLSIADFSMVWDSNWQYSYYNREQNYCSLVNNSHLRADNVSLNLFTRNDRWTFVTFPFDVKLSEVETISEGTTNWVVRKYDGQARAAGETGTTWVRLGADDVLKAGEGYILQSSRYIGTSWQDYSGFKVKAVNNGQKNNIFQAGDAVVPLKEYASEFAHNRSWNLIGNPYPCYYDTRKIDTDLPMTMWDQRNNTYTAYSPADDAYILCPGEAFFVQCPVGMSSITFGKEGRQTNRTAVTPAAARAADATDAGRIIINLTLTDGNTTDRTRVVLNEKASADYEMERDAPKFMSTDTTVPQLYTVEGNTDYAINERPLGNAQAALAIRTAADALYTIALTRDVESCNVLLEDKLEGTLTELTSDSPYIFPAKAGTHASRFVLHFAKGGSTTHISGISGDDSNGDARKVYDLQGRQMDEQPRQGLYIVNGKKVMLNK